MVRAIAGVRAGDGGDVARGRGEGVVPMAGVDENEEKEHYFVCVVVLHDENHRVILSLMLIQEVEGGHNGNVLQFCGTRKLVNKCKSMMIFRTYSECISGHFSLVIEQGRSNRNLQSECPERSLKLNHLYQHK